MMRRTHRTAVRCWRLRRNPLRRRSDVVEAWVVLIAWALAVVGGVLAGVVSASAVASGLARERAGQQKVSAVVTQDTADDGPARTLEFPQIRATVSWTAPDGSVHHRADPGAAKRRRRDPHHRLDQRARRTGLRSALPREGCLPSDGRGRAGRGRRGRLERTVRAVAASMREKIRSLISATGPSHCTAGVARAAG
ncbi:Rv1733c family protein [Streptomyces chiangmaiensis]|uniref:Uncharacterized protein n=1 Tax=Streptomyces chiangmaiensis TaxID=766497 RepID=A0ABU7FY27_9ACTN|nr:hypothetical protein [Streptomyces chiangmaiensis]MED7827979.1 hypothetical protein [Streptomyces chiangmaiensis]